MDRDLHRDLSWLIACPDDFNRLCRATLEAPGSFGAEIRKLAGYSLDADRLIRLAKTIASGLAKRYDFSPLAPFRMSLVGNGTSEFIRAGLIATAARHGLALDCAAAGYGQALQDSLQPDSAIHRDAPAVVLIALDWRALPLGLTPGDAAAAEGSVEAALDYLDSIRAAVRRNSGAICMVQNLAAPPEGTFGSLDRRLPGTLRCLIDGVNSGLVKRLRDSPDVLFDVAGIAETVGLSNWHSPNEWNTAKLPFALEYLPLYADHVCRLLAAQRGLSRRCLVLDLDNTLWGGVIGDDGLNGIHIGQGDGVGEAYADFQRYVIALRDRGVVLAVCSKNEEEAARLPFREHPDMLLRDGDFAVFQANWNDKATNIQAIADTLALGLESFVFVDDNPFERTLVREMLPKVAVPEMPEDPAWYARTLSAAGYFEALTFSEEDTKRASYYAGNAQRAILGRQAGDLNAYLASLEMKITFQPFLETARARVAQLINKSNQFNLTTRRYTEAEVARLESDPSVFTLQVRLRDKLGDNGMISVVICRPAEPSVWEIDTWLMSCRVLGRLVETAVLRELLEHARGRGVTRLRGVYLRTDRNKLVQEHYPNLGFALVEARNDASVWELDIASSNAPPPPMAVTSMGFQTAAPGASS